MWKYMTVIWGWIQWVFTALLPFNKSADFSTLLRWAIWIVLDAAVLFLLWRVNADARVKAWWTGWRFLEEWYLPCAGQLLIFFAVILYWYSKIDTDKTEESPFSDIDKAWQEGMQALLQAGIRVRKLPLFLVLGRPSSSEANLFEASAIKLEVKQTPGDPMAPLHVFAERDAIYVTCHGASVLGQLARILANPPKVVGSAIEGTGKPGEEIEEVVRATEGREATTLEKRKAHRITLGKPLASHLLSKTKEVAKHTARLAHLCRLIVRDRQPHCAVNGILLLIPLAGTDTPDEARLTAEACKEDLHTARRELKVDCPVLSVMVDVEELPGFTDFVQRQSSKQLRSRSGGGFPMSPRLAREEIREEIRKSLAWICSTYLQDSVNHAFRNESVTNTDTGPLFPGNAGLVLFLADMNDRSEALTTIILQAIAAENAPVFRYTGCYLAGTGAAGNQAFVAGILEKLVKEQNSVTWTELAKEEDARNHAWANIYFWATWVLLTLWCLLLAALIYFKRA